MNLKKNFYIKENEYIADPKAIVKGDKFRFTVLTSRIIRIEICETNSFIDRVSQIFLYRKQPVPKFEVKSSDHHLEIITEHVHLRYNKLYENFTKLPLSIEIKETGDIWYYGDEDARNLKGTARTLDGANGAIPLDFGLMSRSGWCVIDDSKSLIFNDHGWLEPREQNAMDLYFFGYGKEYEQCIKDFCKIAGSVPLIPRWSLGNWWSRYWEYSQEELTGLMLEFEKKKVPLSVCIVDMDWHIVKIKEYLKKHSQEDWSNVKFKDGWTGFTWNEDLFPNYKVFIKFLHKKGLKCALNLHPASGIYPHEIQYKEMAEFMGIDPKTKIPIEFDISDPKFTEAYFKFIYHPYEEDGIDFWWMDWQQEQTTKIKGLDPLWWLNHLSFHDLGREGKKRPFTFSRYGGLGNHRYPIGFSGDTRSSWDSLSFLPYFTSTASNVGFYWWSHDLGGYLGGFGADPELYLRWTQFGLFSPIFRLHSTKNPYNERLPWGFNKDIFEIVKEAMQLRHSFIPYIYSMAWKIYKESIPLIKPMYYLHSNEENAYNSPNQYYFGSEIICSPFLSQIDDDLSRSRQEIWLPEGIWFDFFTGEYYEGNNNYAIYGKLNDIPVFAKAGAIIPLASKNITETQWNDVSNPLSLDIIIFPGADNEFNLYEDDGETQDYLAGMYSLTEFRLIYKKRHLMLKINKILGNEAYKSEPQQRNYNFIFKGINDPDDIKIQINRNQVEVQSEYEDLDQILKITGIKIYNADELTITLTKKSGQFVSKRDRVIEKCKNLLKFMKIDMDLKNHIDSRLKELKKDIKKFKRLLLIMTNEEALKSLNLSEFELEAVGSAIQIFKLGLVYETLLPDFTGKTIKEQLLNVSIEDRDDAKEVYSKIFDKISVLRSMFALKDSQIKALFEVLMNHSYPKLSGLFSQFQL